MNFKKSTRRYKKYMVTLSNGSTVHFGDNRYQQYKDKTGLGLYTHMDHLDKDRRVRYKKRHESTRHKKYSPSWFSDKYLW